MRARKFIALLLLVLLLLARPVLAAWGSLNTLGSNQSKTANQSSLVLTTTAAAEAGNVAIACVATDNNSTTDQDEGAVSSITDSAGGNTWTKAREWTNAGGAANAGATTSGWYSKLTNQINSGGTITANFTNSASRDATAISAWEFSIGAGNVVTVEDGTQVSDDATVEYSALTLSGLPNAEHLFFRCIAHEGDVTDVNITPTTGYTGITVNGTTGAGTATNMSVLGEFRTLTGTTDTSDPTSIFTSSEKVSVFVAFKEAAPSARNRVWSSAKAHPRVRQQGNIINGRAVISERRPQRRSQPAMRAAVK